MIHSTIIMLSIGLGFLIFIAAFFSAAETGLMAANRYRLRHKARMNKSYAILILKLLQRPDRLLGTILIGNTFANIVASALATLLAVHFYGDKGVILSTIILTLVMIIFAEVSPKTFSAIYPERVSKIVAYPVFLLLKLFYPLVVFVNFFANGFLRVLGVKITNVGLEALSREELRSIVYETASRISHHHQSMLLGILDLNQIKVEEVMIPSHDIVGIDIDQSWEKIKKKIGSSQHDWLPVYNENINNVIGILHIRDLMRDLLSNVIFNKETLSKLFIEPYFVPEGTPLNIQLSNFQQQRKRVALVVDEYGEILGLLTLADIFEEIVGEFTTNAAVPHQFIQAQADGSFLVDGSTEIRILNRATQWKLPARWPRTLSGLIIEHLESIPHVGTCIKIADHPIEIIAVEDNLVKTARIYPKLI